MNPTAAQTRSAETLVVKHGPTTKRRLIPHAEGADYALTWASHGYIIVPDGRAIRMPA